MLDTKVIVFHEKTSYSLKWPWNCISWNTQKEKFHSVILPLIVSNEKDENVALR